jgi:hypothetical protein
VWQDVSLSARGRVPREQGVSHPWKVVQLFHHQLTCAYRGHADFSESTEEIAPLTEEERKQKLLELREKVAAKRANQALVDKEEQKRNEVCFLLSNIPFFVLIH